MIIDITGVELIPGNGGKHCKGNGLFVDSSGKIIECCCEECDYLLCCMGSHDSKKCEECLDRKCPNVKVKIQE